MILLETRKLLKQFGEFRAVDQVDFRARALSHHTRHRTSDAA